uniref:(northern house mosquito) hypothetical protein n=1 Tax=Culex pipiens TaxID=7175 RepID=A0A8D8A1D6_CULPI
MLYAAAVGRSPSVLESSPIEGGSQSLKNLHSPNGRGRRTGLGKTVRRSTSTASVRRGTSSHAPKGTPVEGFIPQQCIRERGQMSTARAGNVPLSADWRRLAFLYQLPESLLKQVHLRNVPALLYSTN